MTDGPELLDSRGGDRLTRERRRPARRTAALVAAGVGVVVLAGAGWAAWSFFSTGAQPAAALPAGTIAYASIDLDPNGGQKIEALRTLRKFPAFKDEVGLGKHDDVRKWIVEQANDDAGCDIDYDAEVEPWLGNRFAVAAIDSGAKTPDPVFVVQVSDEDKAKKGLEQLRSCGDGSDSGAWAVADGWAVIGETQEIVDRVADDAQEKSLADDDDFQSWTDEAGDSGIVSMYAAPAAGKLLADNLGELGGLSSLGGNDAVVPDETTEVLDDFRGAAATLRFDDGGLELEVAADAGHTGKIASGDEAGDAVGSLPESTVAALAFSLGDGWFDQVLKSTGQSSDELVDAAREALGLELPADAEALAGDAVAIALDEHADFDSLLSGSGDGLGAGVKVLGDPDAVEGVLDKLRTAAGGQDQGFLDSDTGDAAVAVGPDEAYRKSLLADGGLGDSDRFGRVVEHPDDASAVVYVDFDGGGDWLADLSDDDDDVRANLKPLDALGLSSWLDDDTTHAVLKVTTD